MDTIRADLDNPLYKCCACHRKGLKLWKAGGGALYCARCGLDQQRRIGVDAADLPKDAVDIDEDGRWVWESSTAKGLVQSIGDLTPAAWACGKGPTDVWQSFVYAFPVRAQDAETDIIWMEWRKMPTHPGDEDRRIVRDTPPIVPAGADVDPDWGLEDF